MTNKNDNYKITGFEEQKSLFAALTAASKIELSRAALINILQRYLDDALPLATLADFAELLEMSDKMNCDKPRDNVINNALFELANPEINGFATKESVRSLIASLSEIV
jgi:hypothetical protein